MPSPIQSHRSDQVVAIIGGGLSGAVLAWNLARLRGADELRIVVIEPRDALGQGLAYSTPDPDHRLNVPEHKMSLISDQPLHFQDWLASGRAPWIAPVSTTATGDVFVPRQVFGRYIAEHLQEQIDAGRITHLRGRAVAAQRHAGGFRIRLDNGALVEAQRVVLAATHPAPALPGALAPLRGTPALIADPYAPDALAAIPAEGDVLIVGSGLTGADIVASLHRRGHRGRIHLLSRHGRRSQPHGPQQAETTADFSVAPERTALALLRRIRRALAQDLAAGLTWHPLFDRLRVQGPQIWAALPQVERRRLLRHLRGLWDIHRFRIAPQTHEVLGRLIESGQVRPITGNVTRTDPGQVVMLNIAQRQGDALSLRVTHVVLATGPAHGAVIAQNPVLADLARQGLIGPDPLALGIWTTPDGQAIAQDGQAQDDLLVAGPLARGAVGELMGAPEVTIWAENLALRLSRDLARPASAA